MIPFISLFHNKVRKKCFFGGIFIVVKTSSHKSISSKLDVLKKRRIRISDSSELNRDYISFYIQTHYASDNVR